MENKKFISFTVFGDPISLKRHRTFNRGGKSFNYDPSSGDKADFLAKTMQSKPDEPLTGPLEISLIFVFGRPKSHFNSKGLKDSDFFHSKRPDIDNLIKFVLDALNGVYFRDDSQICFLSAKKIYSESPHVQIILKSV